MISKTILAGYLIWGSFIAVVFCLRPGSGLHRITLETADSTVRKRLTIAVLICVILLCILPMGLSPSYNGERPDYTDQYERMAESILNGHFYIDYDDIDPRLLAMDNPYDFEARKAEGVSYHWDHAFYNGHYYMYFGVVPVFLLFLPYRILTGTALTTYHATQVFTVLFICGIFSAFHSLARIFFKKMPLAMYLTLSAAFSVMSVWYSVDAPALYCTAITAALCMEVWSIFFFIRAVFGSMEEEQSVRYAFFGSLFGALAFGCRPPVALANLLVLPMLAEYLRGKRITFRLFRRLLFAASPYFVIAALLMLYNYMRFGSPFEFGQSYQLTITDQSQYGDLFSQLDFLKLYNGITAFFVSHTPMGDTFPYVSFNGILLNFPVLCFAVFGIGSEGVRGEIRADHMRHSIRCLFCIPVVIALADVLWAPTVLERYRMDIYWIMGILCFIVIGYYHRNLSGRSARIFSCVISIWAFITICKCFLLYLVPFDYNFTIYFPEKLEKIRKMIMLGRGVGII